MARSAVINCSLWAGRSVQTHRPVCFAAQGKTGARACSQSQRRNRLAGRNGYADRACGVLAWGGAWQLSIAMADLLVALEAGSGKRAGGRGPALRAPRSPRTGRPTLSRSPDFGRVGPHTEAPMKAAPAKSWNVSINEKGVLAAAVTIGHSGFIVIFLARSSGC